MLTIKLTDEQMSQLGISTSEQALELLAAKPEPTPAPAPTPAVSTDASFAKFEAALKTLSDSLNTKIEAVIKEAKIVASQEVSSAIAKSGSAAVAPQTMKPDENPSPAKPDADDYVGQFKADKNIQAEFISERAYVLFMEAQKQGRITINKTRS